MPQLRLAILYKSYTTGMGDHCCSAAELAVELVTVPNHYLYKQSELVRWQGKTFCRNVVYAIHNRES